MNSKHLAVAAALLFLAGAASGTAVAQTPPPASTTAAPATPGAAPSTPAAAPAATTPAPAPAPVTTPSPNPNAGKANPYGLGALWSTGDLVEKSVLVLLGIMSAGTWYIFFMKFFEQSRLISQARIVDRRFWSSNTLNEGIDKLPKNSVFRSVAESGVRSSSGVSSGLVNVNDFIGMSLNRQLEEANSRLQGGIAFLASVGSTAPFVGLFGTVWGVLNALINIGLAGQPSIDKVAGPVGQALIATAIGLFAAVPAVLLYNFLVRRNKIINEKLRSFASDLQTYLITNKK
ncbi:MAG TPA: MotA/TolQ/ExbB proton channel family protein [Rhizomicrobium sp.]|nr:MotA/TolQ/ExbB proton channel family protein [Rhizomicrobium sp.]